MLNVRASLVDAGSTSTSVISQPQAMFVAVVAVAAAVIYALHPPAAPDLAAQVARVGAARSGVFIWWSGWFGGIQLPAYSALSPWVMAEIGVPVASALAALGVTGLSFVVFRDSRRPMAGVIALSAAAFADILAGRATFALGAAAAMASLVLIRRSSAKSAFVLGAVAYLFSPLAGLFLGFAALTVAITEPKRRRAAACVAAVLGVASVAQILAFPGGGHMPFPWWHMVISLATIATVAATCPGRTLRIGCGIVAAAVLFFFVVQTPVGTNVVRLLWLTAAPIVAAKSQLRRLPMLAVVAALAVWPAIDLGIQLDRASGPASQAAFFSPLIQAWKHQATLDGPAAQGERVELVNPASQWGAAYVAPVVPIARGWDRPTDRADNPLFYNGTLTTASYGAWLQSVSAGWVALPRRVGLDYASVAEARIVRSQPSYLHLVWQDKAWQLFRVVDAQPIIRGATLLNVTNSGLTFQAPAASAVDLTVRWSPYLQLRSDGQSVAACISDARPWTTVDVPRPGIYTLTGAFVLYRRSTSAACSSVNDPVPPPPTPSP